MTAAKRTKKDERRELAKIRRDIRELLAARHPETGKNVYERLAELIHQAADPKVSVQAIRVAVTAAVPDRYQLEVEAEGGSGPDIIVETVIDRKPDAVFEPESTKESSGV
jgi:transcriptional/translational regulatory protein YebC/TACO1